MRRSITAIWVLAWTILVPGTRSQTAARGRTIPAIDDSRLIRMAGSVHPFARPEAAAGRASTELPINRILLALRRTPKRQKALDAFLQAQQDPSSPMHHRWVTPEQFGEQFEPSAEDVAAVVGWLSSKGLSVGRAARGRGWIEFSSTVAAVEQAFHTEIHKYVLGDREYWTDSSEISIPAALSSVVQGVVSLNNFTAAETQAQPKLTDAGNYYIALGDFNTLYNVTPILGTYTGKGATIAVIGTASFEQSDVGDFRYRFSLPTYTAQQFQMIYNGPNAEGDLGDPVESLFDATFAGAIAKGANVIFVDSPQTTATPGAMLSEQYVVDNNIADIITESYGMCETDAAAKGLFASLVGIREQAAAQGMTWVVAAGDAGPYGCDNFHGTLYVSSPPEASVSAFASSPYTVAVGGTEFTGDIGNSGQYWTAQNTAGASVRSYIPEGAWNESCAYEAPCFTSIVAGGGGPSVGAKPSWQAGVPGVLNDASRDLPDVAFSAAGQDEYVLCMNGGCAPNGTSKFQWRGFRGTSAAAPAFASILALVRKKVGWRMGNINPTLYVLARSQDYSACSASGPPDQACIFNDIVSGNTAVPGADPTIYAAGPGYDMATGLGSVNVTNLVCAWPAPRLTATQTTLSATPATAAVEASVLVSIQVAAGSGSSTLTGPVSVVSSGGPSFPVGLLANGAAQATIPNLPEGTYSLTAQHGGDPGFAVSSSAAVPVTVGASPILSRNYPMS
jgi:subtilase family serine protease